MVGCGVTSRISDELRHIICTQDLGEWGRFGGKRLKEE